MELISGLLTLSTLTFILGLILSLTLVYSVIVSIQEREPRAAKILSFVAILVAIIYFFIPQYLTNYKDIYQIVFLIIPIFTLLIFSFQIKTKIKKRKDIPNKKIDERDIMFSRNLLKPGSDRFNDYYNANPDNLEVDNNFRKNPGLMRKGSYYHNPFHFASAHASFVAVEQFHTMVEGQSSKEVVKVDSNDLSVYLKAWIKKLGAVSVGFTKLEEYHKYSQVGRGEDFGKEVILDHKYAIAFTVEMDKYAMDYAPAGPTVMESAQQYLNAGAIAIQVAEFLRHLGFDSRAHIDANYRVVCPLVARDAGLGELGRMGLLMTPELGPRVRIGVVTTDAELVVDERKFIDSMIEFCKECKKCADVCPSNAISFDDQEEIDGAVRWQINQEQCFTIWTQFGTDCGRCVSVCPYSHHDNLLHNIIRKGIDNSVLFRKAALKLDDIIYGRKPESRSVDGWLDI